MYTKKVDMITEMSGAIAETQKSFLFFFPWIIERDSVITTYSQRKTNMWFWSMLMLSYNVLGNQKECQEGCTDQYCLPIPLQQEYRLNCLKCSNIGVFIRHEKRSTTRYKISYPMVNISPDWFHDRYNIAFLGEMCNSKESFQLLKSNGDGSTGHESDDGSMRQKLYDKP